MFHLPAYLALERWVTGRRIVVVEPKGPEGPRMLRDAGAFQVLVISSSFEREQGIESRPASAGRFPLRDRSVDAVLCFESFAERDDSDRAALLAEASRVLRDDGLFAAWSRQPDTKLFGQAPSGAQLDFYNLEDDSARVFPYVRILAQMPWLGFSIAAVPDEDELDIPEPRLALDEQLLVEAPEATHYIALASHEEIPPEVLSVCSMIPVPAADLWADASNDDVLDELETLREELSQRAARAVAAQGRSRELESQLQNVRARADEALETATADLKEALTEARSQAGRAQALETELRKRLEGVESERGALLEQLASARDTIEANKTALAKGEAERSQLERAQGKRQSTDQNDLAILTSTVADQERTIARLAEQLTAAKEKVEGATHRERQLSEQMIGLDGEREELRRQVGVLVAEGDGARKLAARVEAELDVLRTRHQEQADRLSAKVEESSRLGAEVDLLRSRLSEQEGHLEQTRTRAEELSVSVAEGAEKGRMLSELATDRDRLREELGTRNRHIEILEEKVWSGREALQREKLEAVRLGGEVERLRELLDRGRGLEQQRAGELEAVNVELRNLELERVELRALLRAREERLSQLLNEADAMAGRGEDVIALHGQLEGKRGESEALRARLDKAEHMHRQAQALADQRSQDLSQLRESLRSIERRSEERGDLAARLQTELDVRVLELQQTKTALKKVQEESQLRASKVDSLNTETQGRQRELERARVREADLRRRVFELESQLDRAQSQAEHHSEAVLELRLELESATGLREEGDSLDAGRLDPKADLLARVHAAERELEGVRRGVEGDGDDGLRQELRKLQLKNEIRASEQEFMLAELDAAEQRIWEMTDASDRNAARFAASLAQLEKHKERTDQLLDELEVARALLAAEQARTLEQERLLASERAKLARAGLGSEGFPRREDDHEVDEVFAELNPGGGRLMRLGAGPQPSGPGPAPGVPPMPLEGGFAELVGGAKPHPAPSRPGVPAVVNDRGATSNVRSRPDTPHDSRRARVLVEEVDEEEWVNE